MKTEQTVWTQTSGPYNGILVKKNHFTMHQLSTQHKNHVQSQRMKKKQPTNLSSLGWTKGSNAEERAS